VKLDLASGWMVLQDVHDTGESLRLFGEELDHTEHGHQLSEWSPIDRLQHLQVLFADRPYWGRELRYFNDAPWWYLNEFRAEALEGRALLKFTNVDYFCRVWLNGQLLGQHEGYSAPFQFDVTDVLRREGVNRLVVKVWSPWDDAVAEGRHDLRAFRVVRDMVKGTYEHDDCLIARDVNPVGIYGSVVVESAPSLEFDQIGYELSEDRSRAGIRVSMKLVGTDETAVTVRVREAASGRLVAEASAAVSVEEAGARARAELDIDDVLLWNTWDSGDPNLYVVEALAADEKITRRLGVRSVSMNRTTDQTQLLLNGSPLYIRGTSYFADAYISTMTRERYLRDLRAIRDAGFNLVRVHVHVELKEFYELCDELGLAVMQDSEYNWTHPLEQEWNRRLIDIYLDTVRMLDEHPSVITWICLNEPGFAGGAIKDNTGGAAMAVSPGPQLFEAVTAADPTRTIIKGSFCTDDPFSGDSHNYKGSLEGNTENYTGIDGTTEKLNSEFGFDSPGIEAHLRSIPQMYDRLRPMLGGLEQIQEYQYRLTKYYIEHYRAQKAAPNWGYIQFMFIDLSPQSFYGVVDWWGMPKRALDALLESNQPVAVLLEQTATQTSQVLVVNDTNAALGTLTVSVHVQADGEVVVDEVYEAAVGSSTKVVVAPLRLDADGRRFDVQISVRNADSRLVAQNRYQDMFAHPAHPEGHPHRMSHELGMRLYDA